jgi:hypothetical protein
MAKWRWQLKTHRASDDHSCRTVPGINSALPSLNALLASTNKNPHSSSCGSVFAKEVWQHVRQLHSCLEARAQLVNSTSLFRLVSMNKHGTHFDSSLSKVSPTPNERTPGILSAATSRPDRRARCAAHGRLSLAFHRTNPATASRISALGPPKQKSQCCRSDASVPPGPALIVSLCDELTLFDCQEWRA